MVKLSERTTLLLLLAVIVRALFIFGSLEVADVVLMKMMAEKVLSGVNPYLRPDFYVYPPLGLLVLTISLSLASGFNVPFNFIVRIWPNIADFAISALLFLILRKKGLSKSRAVSWSLFYLLNPMTVIISSAQGQLDSLPIFLVLVSFFFSEFKKRWKQRFLGMFALGLSFAIKPNSIILLPLFLFDRKEAFKKKAVLLLASLIPLAASLLPFVFDSPMTVLSNITKYSGSYDFGYGAIFRALAYQNNADLWIVNSARFFEASKIVFLIGLVFLYFIFIGRRQLSTAALAVFLLYNTVYFGVGAQQLVWILPFAILSLRKEILGFTLVGILSYLGFYTFFGPDILFGRFLFFPPYQSAFMTLYLFGNLLLWVYTAVWLYNTLRAAR